MRISTFAMKGGLLLLAIAPAAAAQDGNRAYREKMDQLTRKRTVSPVRPGDKTYSCAQIQIELAKLDRQLAGDAGAIRASIDAALTARPKELEDDEKVRKVRDAANRAAPAFMSPGNLIEQAYRPTVVAREAVRQHDYLLLAGKSGNDFNFIAARIPYLHALAEERCTPEEQAGIVHDAAATAGPAPGRTPPGPQKTFTRIETNQGAIIGGAVGAAGKRP